MPPAEFVLSPSFVLAMWAGGMAVGVGVIARWQIVSGGFFWVMSATILLIGAWIVPGEPVWGSAAVTLLVLATFLTGRPTIMAAAFGLAGVIWIALAAGVGGWLLAVTGAVALGGVTDEMLLGHWYLVDPRLPRWALRKLDMAAIVALVLDGVVLVLAGAAQDLGVVAWAWLALLALTVLLMVGVWFSIGEQGYNGIMAATGLSYLAVLTALGAVVAGRALIGQVVTQLGRLGL